jgi:hypothetical protein
MKTLIEVIGVVSLLLGLLTGYDYLSHPLASSGYVKYTGGKFWLVALLCAFALFLKGKV